MVSRSRTRGHVVGGWCPPGHYDEAEELLLLSDRIDIDDPAYTYLFQVLAELRRLDFEFTEDVVDRAVRVAKKRCAADEELRQERRGAPNLSADPIDSNCLVYYMRIGNRVKIGTTASLAQRIASVNPEELMAIEPGSYDLEKQRHAEFNQLRVYGEWFKLEMPLTWHISRVQSVAA